ncbi:LysE family transporter [Rhizobium leguminosarum]|uniref:LysE family translocator n=1 Tax=Rhizobium leguminosarum TaxID=384 RepID=UPI001441C1C6|nr:LysE family transporter [Rhizobium leguminosarum]MBY5546087.1 LysE family transporter [Rhizobium leguminosarum]MBY5841484.1 LysE family transporter [Rhizobium leguminosarum]MBY5863749.1 LysE family transporter [Rhizobium leguminosarum]NKM05694.1 LysE family translocator [Rhizobium leguminosarum bv. viciae]NKM82490.1 LysE family translocator [Rhizobium leguminosarum bv. viciae]
MHSLTANLFSLFTIGLVQLVAVISPGPSFLITAQTAAARSRSDGVKVALGLGSGSLLWALAALLGLNMLFHALPTLFFVMKVAGALFILWVAFQIFRHASEPLVIEDRDGAANPFLKGLLTQLSNPKVAVFFGSIFVSMLPAEAPLWMTIALFAIVFLNEFSWYSIVAILFGSGRIRTFYIGMKSWIDRITGLFLGALGLRLLWSARETT